MKKTFIYIILFISSMFLCQRSELEAAVTSVQLTTAGPTVMSTGVGYYLAGKEYSFSVRVIDPSGGFGGGGTTVSLTIPSTTNITVELVVTSTGTGLTPTVTSGTIDVPATSTVTGNTNDFTVTFDLLFRWDSPSRDWAVGTVSGTAGGITDNRIVSYGICVESAMVGLYNDGVGADGYVNPWHSTFNTMGANGTSEIIYNIPGGGLTDAIRLLADAGAGEITLTQLMLDGVAITGATDTDETNGFTFAVPAAEITTLGTRNLTVRSTMSTAGGPSDSSNSLPIICDRVEITNIEIINGSGVNSPYYRSLQVPGTQLRVTAQMQDSTTNVVGNTYVTVQDKTEGINYVVLISTGQASGTRSLVAASPVSASTYPTTPAASETTLEHVYAVVAIDSASVDDEQNLESRIQQPANVSVFWDNLDPPGDAANPFQGTAAIMAPTVNTLTVTWNPLSALNPPEYNEDFYSYRFHYRVQGSTDPWTTIDRNTSGYGSGGYDLQLINTNTFTITNLTPLTNYEYEFSAVDVFGNEVLQVNRDQGVLTTQASQIRVSLTDGIDTYEDESFTNNGLATARPLRHSSVRVGINIISTGGLPDTVNLIVAADGATDLIVSSAINSSLVENVDYFRISCIKTGANDWTGYIPETLSIMTEGASIRFVMEVILGATNYVDHDNELEVAPGFPNDYEWNFALTTPVKVTPWPVRILNNVISSKNPAAYPAYYLSDEAYVTIKVYDVKGRLVKVLLDGARRPSGENIKENGWRGTNKGGKKLGVGLYYIKIRAKRVTDGKIILNSVKKVVMTR